jgi:hypothetical protein
LPSGELLSAVVQQVMSHGNRWTFTDFLQGALDTVGKMPQAFHQAVAELVKSYEVEMIITTAYDDLLEQAFRQAGVALNAVVSDDQLGFMRPERPTLIKLHGDIRQVTSLAVTDQDQNALLRGRLKGEIVDEVRRAFRRNSILFLGYDLSDPAVGAWFDEVAGDRFQRSSYAAWSGLPERQVESYASNRGLMIWSDDYGCRSAGVRGYLLSKILIPFFSRFYVIAPLMARDARLGEIGRMGLTPRRMGCSSAVLSSHAPSSCPRRLSGTHNKSTANHSQ